VLASAFKPISIPGMFELKPPDAALADLYSELEELDALDPAASTLPCCHPPPSLSIKPGPTNTSQNFSPSFKVIIFFWVPDPIMSTLIFLDSTKKFFLDLW
jgi:hypothetical protein